MKKSPRRYPDHVLKLPLLWFTGQEWANGTAVNALRKQYRDECERRMKLSR